MTGWPDGDAAKCRHALNAVTTSMWRRDELDRSEFKLQRRGDRVFIARVESFDARCERLKSTPTPNERKVLEI